MALSYEMRCLIDDLTQDIIREYDISIPIFDIDEIVKRMGGVVKESDLLSEYSDGCIKKVGDGFEIVVSQLQPENRRNFTIAHELGHLFLHMGYKIDADRWNSQQSTYYRKGGSVQEHEANEFAAALLMPRKEYKKIMDRYTEGNHVFTPKIAEEFHVSINAASNRGKWLGYLQW